MAVATSEGEASEGDGTTSADEVEAAALGMSLVPSSIVLIANLP